MTRILLALLCLVLLLGKSQAMDGGPFASPQAQDQNQDSKSNTGKDGKMIRGTKVTELKSETGKVEMVRRTKVADLKSKTGSTDRLFARKQPRQRPRRLFAPKQFGKKNKFGSDQKLESKVRAEGDRKTIKASSDEQHISGDLNMMRNSI